jgi:hypothetical protein
MRAGADGGCMSPALMLDLNLCPYEAVFALLLLTKVLTSRLLPAYTRAFLAITGQNSETPLLLKTIPIRVDVVCAFYGACKSRRASHQRTWA